MNGLTAYPYVGPLVLGPLGYYLWWHRFGGSHRLALSALAMPVLFSYILPAIGTNVLKLWEFHTRWRWGRFRPHHGFVFGTASGLLAWLAIGPLEGSAWIAASLRAGLVVGSVLGFWNWIYDIHAIRSGLITVYNHPYAEGRCAEAIAADYAPVYFGSFGFCYGVMLRAQEYWLIARGRWELSGVLLTTGVIVVLTLPVAVHALFSRWRHGDWGLKPFHREKQDAKYNPSL